MSNRQNESDLIQDTVAKIISPNDLAKTCRVKTYEETKVDKNEDVTRIQIVTTDEPKTTTDESKITADEPSLNQITMVSLLKSIEEISNKE